MTKRLFPANEGGVDRMVRVLAGAGMIGLAAAGYGPWFYIGVVPLATGVLGSCPVYTLLGLNTCSVKTT